jgi:hypothetical protein
VKRKPRGGSGTGQDKAAALARKIFWTTVSYESIKRELKRRLIIIHI